MINVRKFENDDFLSMRPRMWQAEIEDLSSYSDAQISAVLDALGDDTSYTIELREQPVASFGLVIAGDDAEAWVWFTPEVREIKADFEHIISGHLSALAGAHGLKRIECGIIKGYEHLMPWVERLGFKKIGERDMGTPEVRYELCLH